MRTYRHKIGNQRLWALEWRGRKGRIRLLRLVVGGLGYLRPPGGLWTLRPRVERLRRGVYRLRWLHVHLSLNVNRYRLGV